MSMTDIEHYTPVVFRVNTQTLLVYKLVPIIFEDR